MSKGYEFLSETDTEVIAHMLDYYYNGDPLATITKVMHRMEDRMHWVSCSATIRMRCMRSVKTAR